MVPPARGEFMKPLCELCGDRHGSHQAHRFATNAATNRHATNAGATNTTAREVGRAEVDRSVDSEVGLVRTANRRTREAYNAYQREYMRKRRVK